jgi:hypothetical protein
MEKQMESLMERSLNAGSMMADNAVISIPVAPPLPSGAPLRSLAPPPPPLPSLTALFKKPPTPVSNKMGTPLPRGPTAPQNKKSESDETPGMLRVLKELSQFKRNPLDMSSTPRSSYLNSKKQLEVNNTANKSQKEVMKETLGRLIQPAFDPSDFGITNSRRLTRRQKALVRTDQENNEYPF